MDLSSNNHNRSIKNLILTLIVLAILVNALPGFMQMQDMETFRNYANIGIVIIFSILTIIKLRQKHITEGMPKNTPDTPTAPPANPDDNQILFK